MMWDQTTRRMDSMKLALQGRLGVQTLFPPCWIKLMPAVASPGPQEEAQQHGHLIAAMETGGSAGLLPIVAGLIELQPHCSCPDAW